jgi:hypothetical protein
MSEGVGGSVGADLAAIGGRPRDAIADHAALLQEAEADAERDTEWRKGYTAGWAHAQQHERDAALAEVSRLGQQLDDVGQVADDWKSTANLWRQRYDAMTEQAQREEALRGTAIAERDAALALVGQLQGQLGAVRKVIRDCDAIPMHVQGWNVVLVDDVRAALTSTDTPKTDSTGA